MIYRCPSCRSADDLEIVVTSWAQLDQSDPDNPQTVESSYDADSEWDDNSNASCLNCHWTGTVRRLQEHA